MWFTFRVKKSCHPVFSLHDVECQLDPLSDAHALHLLPVQEVGPVPVDDGVEGEAVAPALGEVGHVDARVAVGRLLGPSEQGIAGREVLLSNDNI